MLVPLLLHCSSVRKARTRTIHVTKELLAFRVNVHATISKRNGRALAYACIDVHYKL